MMLFPISGNSSTKMENSTFDKMDNQEKMIKGDGTDNIEVFRKVIFEPIRIGAVSTLDEMDCKVLQFQNKKLEMVRHVSKVRVNV